VRISPGSIVLALSVAEEQSCLLMHETAAPEACNGHLVATLAGRTTPDAQSSQIAYHDAMTGLPTRTMLLEQLLKAIAEAFQCNRQLALMFIDLDGFKVMDGTPGHTAGSKLLAIVATRILSCVSADDIASEFGGDEFPVPVADIAGTENALGIAERIRAGVDGRYWIGGQELDVSASIGLAMHPEDSGQGEALSRTADGSGVRRHATSVETSTQGALMPAPKYFGEPVIPASVRSGTG